MERRSMVSTLLLKVINKNFPTIITYKILSFSLQKLLKQTLFGTRYIPHRSQTVKIRSITWINHSKLILKKTKTFKEHKRTEDKR
jgi:hypothetical protein